MMIELAVLGEAANPPPRLAFVLARPEDHFAAGAPFLRTRVRGANNQPFITLHIKAAHIVVVIGSSDGGEIPLRVLPMRDGPLAVAAVRAGLEVARENIEENGIAGGIEVEITRVEEAAFGGVVMDQCRIFDVGKGERQGRAIRRGPPRCLKGNGESAGVRLAGAS